SNGGWCHGSAHRRKSRICPWCCSFHAPSEPATVIAKMGRAARCSFYSSALGLYLASVPPLHCRKCSVPLAPSHLQKLLNESRSQLGLPLNIHCKALSFLDEVAYIKRTSVPTRFVTIPNACEPWVKNPWQTLQPRGRSVRLRGHAGLGTNTTARLTETSRPTPGGTCFLRLFLHNGRGFFQSL